MVFALVGDSTITSAFSSLATASSKRNLDHPSQEIFYTGRVVSLFFQGALRWAQINLHSEITRLIFQGLRRLKLLQGNGVVKS